MKPGPKNLAASVHRRLLNIAREQGVEFRFLLTRFALERLLFRISASAFSIRFILKGAMLFTAWTGNPHRATKDLDLLGQGPNDIASMEESFRQIVRTAVPEDGLQFLEASVAGSRIREDEKYEAVRIRLEARLGKARIPIQVDIGFGDAVHPAPKEMDYPSVLGMPAPHLRAYRPETVIAEKLEAMVSLGMGNSRMKDFFDIWVLSRSFPFASSDLLEAVAATFERRGTARPSSAPVALTADFCENPEKRAQWTAFLNKNRLPPSTPNLSEVVSALRDFLLPVLRQKIQRDRHWPRGGPWPA